MSVVLEKQLMSKVAGLSDENLLFLCNMIDRFMKPDTASAKQVNRIGIKDGQVLYATDYDYDELNDQIADMFGGNE